MPLSDMAINLDAILTAVKTDSLYAVEADVATRNTNHQNMSSAASIDQQFLEQEFALISEAVISPPQREVAQAMASIRPNLHTSKVEVEQASKTLKSYKTLEQDRVKMIKLQMALNKPKGNKWKYLSKLKVEAKENIRVIDKKLKPFMKIQKKQRFTKMALPLLKSRIYNAIYHDSQQGNQTQQSNLAKVLDHSLNQL